jgi:hypothetical protein
MAERERQRGGIYRREGNKATRFYIKSRYDAICGEDMKLLIMFIALCIIEIVIELSATSRATYSVNGVVGSAMTITRAIDRFFTRRSGFLRVQINIEMNKWIHLKRYDDERREIISFRIPCVPH